MTEDEENKADNNVHFNGGDDDDCDDDDDDNNEDDDEVDEPIVMLPLCRADLTSREGDIMHNNNPSSTPFRAFDYEKPKHHSSTSYKKRHVDDSATKPFGNDVEINANNVTSDLFLKVFLIACIIILKIDEFCN